MAPKNVNNKKAAAKQANAKAIAKASGKANAKVTPLLALPPPPEAPPASTPLPPSSEPGSSSAAASTAAPPQPLAGAAVPIKQELPETAVAKVEFSNSEKVMFSRWLNKCPERKLQYTNFNATEKNQLKANWSLDPEKAAHHVLVTASQTKKVTTHGGDEWLTKAEIAGKMNLNPLTQAAELEELLSGLPKQPSRFAHLRGKSQWDEYWWSKSNGSDETDETTKQAIVQSKGKMTAHEASSAHAALMEAPGNPALPGKPSGSGGAAPKATPKRKKSALQLEDDHGTNKKKKKKEESSDKALLKMHHNLMIVLGKVRATLTQGNARLGNEPWLKGLLDKVSDSIEVLENKGNDILKLMGSEPTDEQLDALGKEVKDMTSSCEQGHLKRLKNLLS